MKKGKLILMMLLYTLGFTLIMYGAFEVSDSIPIYRNVKYSELNGIDRYLFAVYMLTMISILYIIGYIYSKFGIFLLKKYKNAEKTKLE